MNFYMVFLRIHCVSPSKRIECLKEVKVETHECVPPCSGLIVTSFTKLDQEKNVDELFPNLMHQYNQFKKITPYPYGVEDLNWKNKLKFVRIYYDTPTYDRITKDRAAKFVDMLSAIGGTMGLLTGFSIISGVEIIYFAGRIFLKSFMSKK